MGWLEAITILAIVVGPVFAVLITRWLDNRRERRTRQMDVFRTLMRTRRTPINTEHVGALNLVEIEFANSPKVVSALRELFRHFGEQHVRRDDEKGDEKFLERIARERATLLTKLLHSMATDLKFKIEQLEIFEGGYTPEGWHYVEKEQSLARGLLVDIAEGKRALPVMVFPPPEKPVPALEDKSKGAADMRTSKRKSTAN